MISFKFFVILTTILVVSFTDFFVKGSCEDMSDEWKHSKKHRCVCPNTTITASTADERRHKTVSVVTTILNTAIPNLTVLSDKFRVILKDVVASPKHIHQQYAAIAANWLSIYMGYLSQKPSGCPMAQLINATVACLDDHDGSMMAPALDIVATQFNSLLSDLIIGTSIAAAGCKMSSSMAEQDTSTIPVYKCFKNGFVYDIKDTWQRLGSKFPDKLRETVMKMYKSNYHLDNFIAVIATCALTPSLNSYIDNWPFGLAFEAISLQNYAPIPKCCCKERMKRITELAELNKKQTALQTQIEKDIYSSKSACCHKRS